MENIYTNLFHRNHLGYDNLFKYDCRIMIQFS